MLASNSFLLDLVKHNRRHAWVGYQAPFDMEIIDIFNCTNYRLSPSLHRRFDVVWYYEPIFSELSMNWKVILDELVRLVGAEGFVVIRTRSGPEPKITIPLIKHYLKRKFGIEVEVSFQTELGVETIIVFKVKRLNIEKYADKSWTFAILTNGKKDESVLQFLKSVRKYGMEHEIIVSGPKKEIYDDYQVTYLDMTKFRDGEYAEISKKKNEIAKLASNANLMIVHDRYVINDDFFKGFEKYGYDFDFLTVKQYDGESEFPSYCSLRPPLMTWKPSVMLNDYNNMNDFIYLNGGLLIFKTHTLKELKFNDLLFWNEMEDVEISRHFSENGVMPRINFFSTAGVIEQKKEYKESFQKERLSSLLEKVVEYWKDLCGGRKILIFGAGESGVLVDKVLRAKGIDILFFVDNDVNKWGKKIGNKCILPPSEIDKGSHFVVVASDWFSSIAEQLKTMALKEECDFSVRYYEQYVTEL